MALAQTMWAADSSGLSTKAAVEPTFMVVEKLEGVLEEARKSQRKEKSLSATIRAAEEHQPSLRSLTSATVAEIDS